MYRMKNLHFALFTSSHMDLEFKFLLLACKWKFIFYKFQTKDALLNETLKPSSV